MHEIVDRFVGRYQVWRDQSAQHNPLNLPALIVVIGVVQTIYNLIARHHVNWWTAFMTIMDVAFLVLYFRKSPFAWLMLPIWGAMILIQFPSMFNLASRYPPRVVLLSGILAFVFGAGFIVWGFAIRRRYYSYIGYQSC